MKKPELLSPAGDMEKLKMAFWYGADATYLAGKSFGMRAQSGNFDDDELFAASEYAKKLGKKIYVTVNIMPHNDEIESLPKYLQMLGRIKADALIVADFGVFQMVKDILPDMPVHISTQANTVNWMSAKFWQQNGATRIVLARELSLAELSGIRKKTTAELEIFVHGAMCISYSGRCLLSSYMTGRDANRGACPQACRWKYHLVEEKRPGEYFPVMEDEHGTYVFNSRDLCLLNYIPEFIGMGIDSFKIEGRMKSVHYVATVTNVYRQAIDAYVNDPEGFCVKDIWLEELEKISHRPYTTAFIAGNPYEKGQVYTTSSYQQTHDFVGLAVKWENGFLLAEQRNNVKKGEQLEMMQPDGSLYTIDAAELYDENGGSIDVAPHPKQLFKVRCDIPVMEHSMLRRKR